ncbi:hypothetical protein FNL37_0659 [Methylovorus glucosotrophus]|uniref:hypothetical protein n=1 Tax=Methylovorus glucosotrophus TaxID=266009 RepID=UPI00147886FD|nr:hypothetical protein [Methylovorus glucosotrophus]KAF0843239.1 hypothetical protein FNL37_0659 [Methylovorus glucosotrophus]
MELNNDNKENFATNPGWRWNAVVIALFLLALAFIGLAFILLIDPKWAYQTLQPVK